MIVDHRRRALLACLAALGLVAPDWAGAEPSAAEFGPATPFSFDALVATAKQMAQAPYSDPPRAADILRQLHYDIFAQIQFRADHTLELAGGKSPVRLFHLHSNAQMPVGIYVVEGDQAREVLYSPKFFDIPADSLARKLPDDIGFAGFRVLNVGKDSDWLAFMGASYFRTSDPLDQYGISARGLAVDTALTTAEEFPRFTDFFLSPSESGTMVVYALMNSPRVTGALKIDIARGQPQTVMTVNARFFARADMERVGIAPLTSMFWTSEMNIRKGLDWRPEIHDSDGLEIVTGKGERLWRPLNNPHRVVVSSFVDDGVKGFGLIQRDRDFEHYQDDGIFYEKRPSLWVEPIGNWGRGQVQLVEIPTDDEVHDNIVAYWQFEKPVKAGDEIAVDYRLHWLKDEPNAPDIGLTYSSRIGRGGAPGQQHPKGVVKFVVDFQGGVLGTLGQQDGVEISATSSRGKISGAYALPVVGTTRWRAVFDFSPATLETVELRLYLHRQGKALTETWAAQYHPTELPKI